uniref:DNA polymerase III, chi subunit n=1 Tax=Candidatus Kentrum eta TaxID=2126337 RepID=A0A450VMS2_9GAMM|nr:MAG: DNA polymerase III, chi subunit [Candidatus Kentron sp. H]VFK03472.1 MAG: DNA polymerase III, chi subunit [Candidatus Kentron sp. H]VFK06085.1 MAG: DNA polymerase III, chi subunit [Candidatus Kentron sp. H]
MTSPRVDFYVLDTTGLSDVPHMACRITEKAWKSGHRVFVHTGARFTASQMDDLLWTFRAEGFVPHAVYGTFANEDAFGDKYPVSIGDGTDPEGALDVVVNLGDAVPPFLARCDRIVEIVGAGTEDRESSRQRYRLYREKGCSLNTHRL